MAWLATVALVFLHALYRLVLVLQSLATRFRPQPRPLVATRSKLPSHLAITLIPNIAADQEANEKYMLNSVAKAVAWCRIIGIPRITVYDREGVLVNRSIDIRRRLLPLVQEEDVEDSPVECDAPYPLPLTPPPSDDADSRPLSTRYRPAVPKLSVITLRYATNFNRPIRKTSGTVKRRRVPRTNEKAEGSPLTLHIVCHKSGKAAIAAAATTLLYDIRDHKTTAPANTLPSMQQFNAVLEGEHGLPSPDLMIVHQKPPAGQVRSPVELGGFPPWQMRLTEIYWNPDLITRLPLTRVPSEQNTHSLEETELRRALDEFADAEFRLGK